MNTKARILFLDDEIGIVNAMRAIFRQQYEVLATTSPVEALEHVRQGNVHAVVSDQRMPDMAGTDFLARVRELSPGTVRLLLTGYSDLQATIDATNTGEIFRYITKPWSHADLQRIVMEAAEIGVRTVALARSTSPAAAGDVPTDAKPVTVMVLDNDVQLSKEVGSLLPNHAETLHAASIQAALGLLRTHDVAVVVADLEVGGADCTPFLRVLKQQYPLIQSVVLSDLSDSDTIVRLINQVRVFRVANKPIRKATLKLNLLAALRNHQICNARPALLSHQAAEKGNDDEDTELTPLRRSLLGSLQALKQRFALLRLV